MWCVKLFLVFAKHFGDIENSDSEDSLLFIKKFC